MVLPRHKRLELFETHQEIILDLVRTANVVGPEGEYSRYVDLAEIYVQNYQYEKAHLWFGKAIMLDPDRIKGYISEGYAYAEQKDYVNAHSSFQTAIDKAKYSFDGYCGLEEINKLSRNILIKTKDFVQGLGYELVDADTDPSTYNTMCYGKEYFSAPIPFLEEFLYMYLLRDHAMTARDYEELISRQRNRSSSNIEGSNIEVAASRVVRVHLHIQTPLGYKQQKHRRLQRLPLLSVLGIRAPMKVDVTSSSPLLVYGLLDILF